MHDEHAGRRAGSAAGHRSGVLPDADRIKLARILGMLGSDHPGERDAAGLAADRLVRQHNASWLDVLTSGRSAPPPPPCVPDAGGLAAALATCHRFAAYLNAWEQAFVDGIADRQHLSAKQRRKLATIAEDLLQRAAA